jgi:hypothetical protein
MCMVTDVSLNNLVDKTMKSSSNLTWDFLRFSLQSPFVNKVSLHVNATFLAIFPQWQLSFRWTLICGGPPINTPNNRSSLHTTNIDLPLHTVLHTQNLMSSTIEMCLICPLIFSPVTTSLHLLWALQRSLGASYDPLKGRHLKPSDQHIFLCRLSFHGSPHKALIPLFVNWKHKQVQRNMNSSVE